jgi:hypothetical protein
MKIPETASPHCLHPVPHKVKAVSQLQDAVGRIISSEICENHAAHNELPVGAHVRSNYDLTRALIVSFGSIWNVKQLDWTRLKMEHREVYR